MAGVYRLLLLSFVTRTLPLSRFRTEEEEKRTHLPIIGCIHLLPISYRIQRSVEIYKGYTQLGITRSGAAVIGHARALIYRIHPNK